MPKHFEGRQDNGPNRDASLQEVRFAVDEATLTPENLPLIEAAIAGVQDTVAVTGSTFSPDIEQFSQSEALSDIEKAYTNRRGQVKVEPFAAALAPLATPQKPAFILIDRDLTAEGLNFAFGFAIKRLGLIIQSTYRWREGINDDQIRQLALRFVARHETGHIFGLGEGTITSQDRRGGIYAGHCTNECTMQQTATVAEAQTLAVQLHDRHTAGFCRECVGYLRTSHR